VRRTIALSVAVVLIAAEMSAQRTQYFFDALTTPSSKSAEDCHADVVRGCVAGRSDHGPDEAWLEVDSFTLDREDYVWLDDAIAEVVLVNRSKSSVRFPWSPDRPPCDDAQRDGWMPPHGSLTIEFFDTARHKRIFWCR